MNVENEIAVQNCFDPIGMNLYKPPTQVMECVKSVFFSSFNKKSLTQKKPTEKHV